MKKSPFPILIIPTLFFVSLSIYLLYQNRQLRDTPLGSKQPTPTELNQSSIPSGWQTFSNDQYRFQVSLPPKWRQVEHSSNFQNFFPFEGPDKSQIQIIVDTTEVKSLDKYLEALDKKNSTSWEGQPAKKVISFSSIKIGQYPALERKEDWLAAGFTTISTYLMIGKQVFIFSLLPYGELSFDKTDSFAIYPNVLSSFKIMKFSCPTNGYVNCMPLLNEEGKAACSTEAISWYKANCKDFKGVAQ